MLIENSWCVARFMVMGEVRFVTSETKEEEAEHGEAQSKAGLEGNFLPLREARLWLGSWG